MCLFTLVCWEGFHFQGIIRITSIDRRPLYECSFMVEFVLSIRSALKVMSFFLLLLDIMYFGGKNRRRLTRKKGIRRQSLLAVVSASWTQLAVRAVEAKNELFVRLLYPIRVHSVLAAVQHVSIFQVVVYVVTSNILLILLITYHSHC